MNFLGLQHIGMKNKKMSLRTEQTTIIKQKNFRTSNLQTLNERNSTKEYTKQDGKECYVWHEATYCRIN